MTDESGLNAMWENVPDELLRLKAENAELRKRIAVLENDAVLSKAAYEGVSSLLLSVQQDCIAERKARLAAEAAIKATK